MYNARIVYTALNRYNLGFSLGKVSCFINKKFKVKTNKSTIYSWILEYKKLCPIEKYREKIVEGKKNLIFKKRFNHINLNYEYMLHNLKLKLFVENKYFCLYSFLKRLEKGCPNVFFEIGKRCSNPTFKINVETSNKKNYACRAAAFSIKAAKENIDRHSFVENFMLINDKSTVACEVPVWYYDKKIGDGVTGHIDIIQIRNNTLYILDYKPNAKSDKKAAGQLYHYAKALSYRARLSIDKIVCAWFDKDIYFEFHPNNIDLK